MRSLGVLHRLLPRLQRLKTRPRLILVRIFLPLARRRVLSLDLSLAQLQLQFLWLPRHLLVVIATLPSGLLFPRMCSTLTKLWRRILLRQMFPSWRRILLRQKFPFQLLVPPLRVLDGYHDHQRFTKHSSFYFSVFRSAVC